MSFQKYLISVNKTIKDALDQIDHLGADTHTLFAVSDSYEIKGALTDGDLRRALLNGAKIEDSLLKAMNKSFKFLIEGAIDLKLLESSKHIGVKLLPVLNEHNQVVRVLDLSKQHSFLPVQAIIMAGGEGQRLRPLTENVPKPLLKVGEHPILGINIDRLASYGITDITISVKYLGEQIVKYFENGERYGVNVSYVREDNSLGTIGAASKVSDFSEDTVLIMNSDLLTNIDYSDFYKFFKDNNADMAIATIPYEVKVPYAVLETEDGNVSSFVEKPTYTYYSNAGIYLVKREILNLIPKDDFYNATDLIEKLIELNKTVKSYPLRVYWLDIGKKEDYKKANEDIKHIQL